MPFQTDDNEATTEASFGISVGPAFDFIINDDVDLDIFVGIGFKGSVTVSNRPPRSQDGLTPVADCTVSTPMITGVKYLDFENSVGGPYEIVRLIFQVIKSQVCGPIGEVRVSVF